MSKWKYQTVEICGKERELISRDGVNYGLSEHEDLQEIGIPYSLPLFVWTDSKFLAEAMRKYQ